MPTMQKLQDFAHGALALIVLVVATFFVITGKLSSDQWVDLSKWVVGIFSSTHAAMSFRKPHTPHPTPLPSAQVVP
jgi:type IV secretory pathway VirB2 component (pilin)